VRPLVAVRRAVAFDPDFVSRDTVLSQLSAAASRLGRWEGFPDVEALGDVFEGERPVRFVSASPRRRRGAPADARAGYDARIALDREVPTRAGCWHDLMNALVWGTFPHAKRALHGRQHRAIAARVAPGDRTLPPTRSRELDALALLDEGGIVVLADDAAYLRSALRPAPGALREHLARGSAHAAVFGHAIYESLVLGVRPAVVAAVVLDREGDCDSAAVDRRLASAIDDPRAFRSPTELARVNLDELRLEAGAA
jgi:Protein of unknown function (DUF3025)